MSAALAYVPPEAHQAANDNDHVSDGVVIHLHKTRHCRGLLQLDLIHWIKSPGFARPFPNHLGSAQTGTSQNGTVARREQYTPFCSTMTNPLPNNDLAGYTGHIKDSATGLNYMQARYYDPLIGRFLSIDPVGFTPDASYMFNRFTYVNNDPLNAIDPFGEESFLLSRPVNNRIARIAKARHLILVTNADYVGDPNSTRFSFGQVDGALRPVTNTGSDTDINDGIAWTNAANDPNIMVQKLNIGPDAVVEAVGNAVIGNDDYGALLNGDSANSNSGPMAIIEAAAGISGIPADQTGADAILNNGNHPRANNTDKVQIGKIDLPPSAFCRGTRIGNSGTGSIC